MYCAIKYLEHMSEKCEFLLLKILNHVLEKSVFAGGGKFSTRVNVQ
jgi:hypothetical protein